ncbi:MAG: SDR family oxidoreductase [Rubellimicrobium sp.]|nr:SDR family oxidoreductase [Rubellimicrobium sp.]
MRILVTGAAGMVGRRLVARLLADGHLGGRAITAMVLHDVAPPPVPMPAPAGAGIAVDAVTGDLSAPGAARALIAPGPDVVFHIAGVVSGSAESDFDLGYRVNLDGTRALWDAVRLSGTAPRVVFTSTTAVYGGPLPETVPDDFAPTPQSSYGTQKLMCELMLADYTRRGFMDGIGLRFPTICVRPGAPNGAASGFFSSIIREPLAGLPALLPVPRDLVHTHASPRSAVGFLLHAATMDTGALAGRPNLVMPGVAVSVAEQIEALVRVAGPGAAALIREADDPAVWAIVRTWPRRFEARRARDLGFEAESDFDAIIRAHQEDGTPAAA